MSESAIASLSLKIDASRAKSGATQYVAAIKTIQNAISKLDRDSDGVFTRLKSGKVSIDTSDLKKASTDTKAFGNASDKAAAEQKKMALAVASASRISASQMDRVYEKAQRLSDTSGIAKLTLAYAQLETRLQSATSLLDVRTAKSSFQDESAAIMRTNRSLEISERVQNQAALAATNHGAELDRLRARFNPLAAASQTYEKELLDIARAEKLGAISAKQAGAAREIAASQLAAASGQMRGYGDAMRVAGHQSQNAAYQIQDVFVTAELGMNPMRIALQQGTQLSMVMNDMARDAGGAKGALSGLVTGITSMINPISLVTIGGIAAVAMLTQWGTSALSAGEETRTFKDQLDDLSTAVSTYQQYADQARQSTSDLTARFGVLAGGAGTASDALAQIARLDAIRAADDAVASLTERYGGLSRTTLAYADGVMPQIEATYLSLREEMALTDVQAATVVSSLERLANAETMAAKVAAANQLNEAFVRVFGSVEAIPAELLNVQREALLLALNVAEIEGATDRATEALARQYQYYAQSRTESDAARATAQEMLATLQAQADMNQLIATYGRDSAQVAAARAGP